MYSKTPVRKIFVRLRVFIGTSSANVRELTNRRLSHDDAVRLRDVTSAHAYMGTCQSRAKVDDVGESDLPASRK